MISFTDILKGNFLAEFSAISVGGMLGAIALAFVLSLFIVYIYRITYSGVSFSRNFAGCMIMIAMVTALVIQVITSNVVLSLGMVGALSIVRFRTAVKEPADTAFLFWAIATGIICGAGYVTISILATLLLGLLFVGVHAFTKQQKTGSYLVVVRCSNSDSAEYTLRKLPGYRLKNKSITAELTELVVELRLTDADMKKVEALREDPEISELSIMASVSGTAL
jgi:uncharacterized membrane protein YhiD involved in acid resistance